MAARLSLRPTKVPLAVKRTKNCIIVAPASFTSNQAACQHLSGQTGSELYCSSESNARGPTT
ncbi:Uncharacterised protein [Mycobacteroides abscessus subsp. massiliense]|nr:Uncharacterised protein [Mycobacteroides abscessus subsp. abscessus]SKH50411.1 Uncharacterised protein [Mycobacteroides abscessus subsp. massiliense]SKK35959.1 Uncharacterised protein [Mycobacteroides abscessus subsp. massiliense]SKK43710.1 Uncharacterised protein [Mycobacteroides abscessus subsp. massiliense]SKL85596.1 Uncharacterised protein [Mycobacteroides abscessus subsp. massiliense]